MDVNWVELIGYIVSLITAAVGWLLGRHTRHSNTIQELLNTIAALSAQIAEYQDKILKLQDEVIEVRKENAELKAGQEIMKHNQRMQTEKMNELQRENRELKELITAK